MEKKYGQRSIKEHEARGEVIPESGGEFSASRKHRIVMVKGAAPFTSKGGRKTYSAIVERPSRGQRTAGRVPRMWQLILRCSPCCIAPERIRLFLTCRLKCGILCLSGGREICYALVRFGHTWILWIVLPVAG